jgi:hypothetical protein
VSELPKIERGVRKMSEIDDLSELLTNQWEWGVSLERMGFAAVRAQAVIRLRQKVKLPSLFNNRD